MTGGARSWAAFAPAAVWAALIFALSARSSVPQPPEVGAIPFIDKVEHFSEYALFAALLFFGLRRGPAFSWSKEPRLHARIAFLAATLYAVSDEVHQSFVPYRQADALDLIFDSLGALSAVLLISYLHLLPSTSEGEEKGEGTA